MLGATVRAARMARAVTPSNPAGHALQERLGAMETRRPSGPDTPRDRNLSQAMGPHRDPAPAPGSVAAEQAAAREGAEMAAARSLRIPEGSRAVRLGHDELQSLRRSLDNPRAFDTDFRSNGIHVRPANGGNGHIQYSLRQGHLHTESLDGARALEGPARQRLLGDPQFRQDMAQQIRNGLQNDPPRDPAAIQRAQQFLIYLRALDLP